MSRVFVVQFFPNTRNKKNLLYPLLIFLSSGAALIRGCLRTSISDLLDRIALLYRSRLIDKSIKKHINQSTDRSISVYTPSSWKSFIFRRRLGSKFLAFTHGLLTSNAPIPKEDASLGAPGRSLQAQKICAASLKNLGLSTGRGIYGMLILPPEFESKIGGKEPKNRQKRNSQTDSKERFSDLLLLRQQQVDEFSPLLF